MNQTQRYCNNILFLLTTLVFQPPFTAHATEAIQSAKLSKFHQEKARMMAIFGCDDFSKDRSCAKLARSTSPEAMYSAAAEKKRNDEKQINERISVLECCLGIDERGSCDGLAESAKNDLQNCRKHVKQPKL